MSSEWFALLPLLVAMLATMILPGFFWLRASLRSTIVAISIAPALSLGVFTLLGQLYHVLGLAWNAWTVLPLMVALALAGFGVWRTSLTRTSGHDTSFTIEPAPPLTTDVPAAHAYRIMTPTHKAWWCCSIGLGWLLAALPTLLIATPTNPAQQWDAVFHINGVWHLVQTQDAGLTSALASMYAGAAGTYYPAAWHITAALFATAHTVTQVGHLMSLMMMFFWVVGATAFTSVVTTSRVAALVSPIVAGMMLSMPSDSLTMYIQWPHALALSLLPGVISGALIFGRRLLRSTENTTHATWRTQSLQWPLATLLLVALLGMAHSHASSLFAFTWTLTIPFLSACVHVIRSQHSHSTRVRAAALISAAAFVIIPFALLFTPQLQGMGNYPRTGLTWTYAVTHALIPLPPLPENIDVLSAGLVFTLLVTYGSVRLYQRSHTWHSARRFALTKHIKTLAETPLGSITWERNVLGPAPALWLVGSYAIWMIATFIAYSPEDLIRTFWLSPWYMDPRRIMGVQNMVMIPLASFGFAALVTWLRSHWPSRTATDGAGSTSQRRFVVIVGIWLLIISVFGAFDSRLYAARYVFDPDHLGKPGMLTQGELDMVKRIPQVIPNNATILGDPIAGAAYVESIGQRHAFFPQLTTSYTGTSDATIFLESFNQIHTNPTVCEALNRHGIQYVYLDADGMYYNFPRSQRAPGLYNVDVSHGFELLDSGDHATLYRITACQK